MYIKWRSKSGLIKYPRLKSCYNSDEHQRLTASRCPSQVRPHCSRPPHLQLTKIDALLASKSESAGLFQSELQLIRQQFDEATTKLSSSTSTDSFKADLLKGHLHMLSELRDRVQNAVKQELTDTEAFNLLATHTKVDVIDIVSRNKVARADPKDFNNFLDINFNLLGLQVSDLKAKAIDHFTRIAPPTLDKHTIHTFVEEVAAGYQINPYHNFTHGFGVAQVFYYMWSISPGLQKLLDSDAMFVGCIAGLGHDIGHRGKNNMFYANTNHYFAKLSLGKSVLEHFHAYRTLQILQNKANMLSTFDKAVH